MVDKQRKVNEQPNKIKASAKSWVGAKPKTTWGKPTNPNNDYRELLREWDYTNKISINEPSIIEWLNVNMDSQSDIIGKEEAEDRYVHLLSEWGYTGKISINDPSILEWLRKKNSPKKKKIAVKEPKEVTSAIKNNPHLSPNKIRDEYRKYKKL